MADTTVSAADFAFVANLVRERCALVLEPGKEYLVKARLLPLGSAARLGGHRAVDRQAPPGPTTA